jgi:hypothetical protein
VQGEWLYVSQYHPIIPMPTAGELVKVKVEQTDRGVWINSLKILGDTAPTSTPAADRDRQIRRQVAIKDDLVLECLPSGEFAYLKPPHHDPRFTLTDAGRRALRMQELFDEDSESCEHGMRT